MSYSVTFGASGRSALVARTNEPSCTVALVREPEGWLCVGLLWCGSAPDVTQAERILAEAAQAVTVAASEPAVAT